jgi:hypothetical protein
MINERPKKVDTYRGLLQSAVSLIFRAFERVGDWPECENLMPHLHSLNGRWRCIRGVNLGLASADLNIWLARAGIVMRR